MHLQAFSERLADILRAWVFVSRIDPGTGNKAMERDTIQAPEARNAPAQIEAPVIYGVGGTRSPADYGRIPRVQSTFAVAQS